MKPVRRNSAAAAGAAASVGDAEDTAEVVGAVAVAAMIAEIVAATGGIAATAGKVICPFSCLLPWRWSSIFLIFPPRELCYSIPYASVCDFCWVNARFNL